MTLKVLITCEIFFGRNAAETEQRVIPQCHAKSDSMMNSTEELAYSCIGEEISQPALVGSNEWSSLDPVVAGYRSAKAMK